MLAVVIVAFATKIVFTFAVGLINKGHLEIIWLLEYLLRMNSTLMERWILHRRISKLDYLSYFLLVLWWNLSTSFMVSEHVALYEAQLTNTRTLRHLIDVVHSPHMRGVIGVNPTLLEGGTLHRFISKLSYSLYCQLIFWWNLNFLKYSWTPKAYWHSLYVLSSVRALKAKGMYFVLCKHLVTKYVI